LCVSPSVSPKKSALSGNERTYVTDTTAENLWSRTIPDANFVLYLFHKNFVLYLFHKNFVLYLLHKNKVRIGQATLMRTNVGPGETIKFQTSVALSGPPVSLSVSPSYLPKELGPAAPPRRISITVNTVPQGAAELRDGTVLSGDVVSVSGMEVVVKVAGSDQRLDRNLVKRILFVQRQVADSPNP
jgi:hypothetical protein